VAGLQRFGSRWHDGQRDEVVLLWNANGTVGFPRIDWPRLRFCITLTTVSRYMKHLMRSYGVVPLVVPDGVTRRLLEPVDDAAASAVRRSLGRGPVLLKVARWDPDKRWNLAIEVVAKLKTEAFPYGLLRAAEWRRTGKRCSITPRKLGLEVQNVTIDARHAEDLSSAFARSRSADILNITTPISADTLRVLYRAADANSNR
jgi:D-inositol-3-phosphate glycosyltransferase